MRTNLTFIRNVRVGKKLLLLVISFLIPITVVVYQLIAEKNISIEFAEKELVGITCLNPLQRLQSSVAKYSMATLMSKENSSATESAHKNVDAELQEVLRINQPLSKELETTKEITLLSKSWDDYSSSRLTEHAKICNVDIRDAISKVGDQSKLVLDPDLDSYYFIDATITHIPRILDQMSQLTMITYLGSEDGVVEHESKEKIDMISGTLHDASIEIKHSVLTALNNAQDKSMPLRIKPLVDKVLLNIHKLEAVSQKEYRRW